MQEKAEEIVARGERQDSDLDETSTKRYPISELSFRITSYIAMTSFMSESTNGVFNKLRYTALWANMRKYNTNANLV